MFLFGTKPSLSPDDIPDPILMVKPKKSIEKLGKTSTQEVSAINREATKTMTAFGSFRIYENVVLLREFFENSYA